MKHFKKITLASTIALMMTTFSNCNNNEELLNETEAKTNASKKESLNTVPFKVMSYNIRHLPSIAVAYQYKEKERAIGQANFINKNNDLDVLVVQEAFNKHVPNFTNRLTYHTQQSGLVGQYCGGWDAGNRSDLYFDAMYRGSNCSSSWFVVNGGVKIYSKWPIVHDQQLIFKSSTYGTSDYNSNKGVAYAKINKNGRIFHVFGMHLQADESDVNYRRTATTREEQLNELTVFMNSLKSSGVIGADEPIIIAGDMNVPDWDAPGVERMKNIIEGNAVDLGNNVPTYDPKNTVNIAMNQIYEPQTLDYIFVSSGAGAKQPMYYPSPSQQTVKAIDASGNDLSDHHPVVQTYYFQY
ncbi:sphingomyelin phosphodiesterase [Tenacibaculum amylolyticum]|uniref:sphingomyelin phosphodiesterase n=1 Tax=Tenacibaculum amylolyticum TaxID=104269 RepID=UPI003893E711